MLDNDLIRLNQKVNVVLTLRGQQIEELKDATLHSGSSTDKQPSDSK
jgi:hypothetical protein